MEYNNNKKKKYYKYHNNHNKHNKHYNGNNKKFHYYKSKKKNKSNVVMNNNNQQEHVNVLLNTEQDLNQVQNVEQEINQDLQQNSNIEQQEVIQRPIQQVLKENSVDYEELDFVPIKKSDKDGLLTKSNFLKYALGFIILVGVVFGVSYSFFTYRAEDSRQGDISSGEVYVKIEEQTVNLTLSKMYPRTNEEARSRSDNYIDFTVKAKNTSETKELAYTLNITNGENVQGKTRINPQYLLVDLEEKVNDEYTYIKNAVPLSTFSFDGVVPVNTTSEITREFRIRVWVSDAIIISDTESNRTYTQAEFNNLFANFNVEINSGDRPRPLTGEEKVRKAITAKINAETNACNPIWVDDNGTANNTSDDVTYFSGTNDCVDMNYVWYSGKLWRITAIYHDGAMKLVTQNMITSIAFNASATGKINFYTDANNTSYMYQWLNEDFYDTLYNANNVIDTSKQWNATMPSDTNVSTKPLETNMVTANVGLLNNYEFYNSYRCIDSSTCTGSSYSTGYLNIEYYWWLLNPCDASVVWRVSNDGNGSSISPANTYGVRPSIYLKSGIEFTGDGTIGSPYKIVGDKDTGVANELVNTRISGEYVKLQNGNNEQVFRIIGVEENKTKIIAMDYADNKSTKKFATDGSDTLWGDGTTTDTDTWYTYLNDSSTGYLKNLKDAYGELFDSGLYYLGIMKGYTYKLSVCANITSGKTSVCDKTSQVGTFNIGLPRYGEMFATQQSGGSSNSINMWLITAYSSYSVPYVWSVGNNGYGSCSKADYTRGVRPTVHLKSTVKILSGSGTETDPYVVGL